MRRQRGLRGFSGASWAALALLSCVANSAWADSYKCENEERVVRRDRHCLPGERELEVTHTRDLHPVRPPPQSAPSAAQAAAAPGAISRVQTPPGSPPGSAAVVAASGVIGATGVITAAEASSPEPAWSMPALSDPPQKHLDNLQKFAAYCQTCAMGEFNAPSCREFWTWSMMAAIAIVMLVLVQILRRLVREQKAINEHKRWLAAQAAVADADTMKQHTWEGDAALEVEGTQEEIAEAIRHAAKPRPQT
jgi:hypothetical protein